MPTSRCTGRSATPSRTRCCTSTTTARASPTRWCRSPSTPTGAGWSPPTARRCSRRRRRRFRGRSDLDPPAPQPWRCFQVGGAIARALEAQPVAGGGDRLLELEPFVPGAKTRPDVPRRRVGQALLRSAEARRLGAVAQYHHRRGRGSRAPRGVELVLPRRRHARTGPPQPDESVFLESWISNSDKVFAVFRPSRGRAAAEAAACYADRPWRAGAPTGSDRAVATSVTPGARGRMAITSGRVSPPISPPRRRSRRCFRRAGEEAWGHASTTSWARSSAIRSPTRWSPGPRRSTSTTSRRATNGFASGAPMDYYTTDDATRAIDDAEAIVRYCEDLLAGSSRDP